MKETEELKRIVSKLQELEVYLKSNNFKNTSVVELFNQLKTIKQIMGNFNNDISLMSCLLAIKYLKENHDIVKDYNILEKPQGAPGLDIDTYTTDNKHIIGEIKTTVPYAKIDFGSKQKENILLDFSKLKNTDADVKYFFVTELRAFEIIIQCYGKYTEGINLVYLESGGKVI